jgi:hypothetical protein
VLSVSEVYRLAGATAPRYRAHVLLATFGNLRWGEPAGLRRSNFSKPWARALAKAGLPAGTHVHDLRHTGNTFTAETGASLAELMNRMGTPRRGPHGCTCTPALAHPPGAGQGDRRHAGQDGQTRAEAGKAVPR